MIQSRFLPERTLCALGLLCAFAVLAVLIGAHELDHLRGVPQDTRTCTVCQWGHGVSASVTSVVLPPTPPLLRAGLCESEPPFVFGSIPERSRPTRAPPAPARPALT